jgi:hypothetical protein
MQGILQQLSEGFIERVIHHIWSFEIPFIRRKQNKPSKERKRDNATYACPGILVKHQSLLCQSQSLAFMNRNR